MTNEEIEQVTAVQETGINNSIDPDSNKFSNDISEASTKLNKMQLRGDLTTTCCEMLQVEHFFKGCKWSCDEIGHRLLTCDGSNRLKVYHTFLNKIDYSMSQISNDTYELCKIGKIYDYDWFPAISPDQYFVVAASSLGPLHIYDMTTARSISSYQMYSMNDEAVHAYCVACSPDGSTIIGGTRDYIFTFDVNKPGRTYQQILTRQHFKRGIISSLAVNPFRHSLFAVGSYNSRIGIYDEKELLCLLNGHTNGITHLKFSPDGILLYSGVRGSGEIICWDLRNPGTALFKLERVVKTQQRIYFDISSNCRFVLSGSTDGDVYIWDTTVPPDGITLLPLHKFQAHADCTNGICVHPQLPFFATTSGQYHIKNFQGTSDDEDDTWPIDVPCREENSLKLWHLNL